MDISSLTPRKQVKLQYWLQVIHECRASGLTNEAWCAQNGVSIKNYYYWIAKIRKLAIEDIPRKQNGTPLALPCETSCEISPPVPGKSGFEEVQLPSHAGTPSEGAPAAVIRIKGVSLEVFEHTSDPFLRRLLEAVREC